jgi:hypothetical protein
MIRIIAAALLLGSASVPSPSKAQGYHYNNGYFRQDGTYVQPHY